MNRCILLNLSHRSGVHMFPAICISALHTCRCYIHKIIHAGRGCMKDEVCTHLGVSQDSRAGNGH
ncbi:hypothetical protein [Citrobacter europaeus]|uniref:hypothetical protein n=1 Tax=Citrobacter europaeus TaxID=1914243 RepID=UPI0035221D06